MTDWMNHAACKDAPVEDFLDIPHPERALTFCARCPVVGSCLEDAVLRGDQDSIRGGMTPAYRRKWAAANGLARHGTTTGYTRDGCRCELCREVMAEAKRASEARRKAAA